jgi:hypothetical protein
MFYKAKKGTMLKNATTTGPEECYEMYFMPFNPELDLVGMLVLARSFLAQQTCAQGLGQLQPSPKADTNMLLE